MHAVTIVESAAFAPAQAAVERARAVTIGSGHELRGGAAGGADFSLERPHERGADTGTSRVRRHGDMAQHGSHEWRRGDCGYRLPSQAARDRGRVPPRTSPAEPDGQLRSRQKGAEPAQAQADAVPADDVHPPRPRVGGADEEADEAAVMDGCDRDAVVVVQVGRQVAGEEAVAECREEAVREGSDVQRCRLGEILSAKGRDPRLLTGFTGDGRLHGRKLRHHVGERHHRSASLRHPVVDLRATPPSPVTSRKLRLHIVAIVTVSLFATLFARLWYLQVLSTEELQTQAVAVQRRAIPVPALRGRILDARGRVLVDNRAAYVVLVDRARLAELPTEERMGLLGDLAARMAPFLPDIDVALLEERLDSRQVSPLVPAPVAEDVPEQLAVLLAEREAAFDGIVTVDIRAVRTYPYGQLAAHVLGYVGAINETELERRRGSADRYQLTDEIGKSGVELVYEDALRGRPGERVLEVDRRGEVVGELSYTPPIPGDDIVLTIDAAVQAVAETALREELERARGRRNNDGVAQPAPAGSTVVLDPTTGGVVAMASYPTYNPTAFTDGIDAAEWQALNDPANHLPLFNRATQGEYAPGSTFKLVTAYAGLASGAITPETTIDDPGTFRVPGCSGGTCTFNNSGRKAWGRVDLRRAISVSSDVYFYELGARFWRERNSLGDPIQEAAARFGFGADTGIPLPDERDGWVPTPENKAERNAENPQAFPYGEWFTGDNVNLAIGQGDMLATPLQLTNAFAALANGGRLLAPTLLREVRDRDGDVRRVEELREIRTIPFQPGWWEALMDGFVGATQDPDGTATATFDGFPGWVIAGKTGTAQVNGKADTALFVGMGPAEAPRYVAGAVLEESGFGGVAAAPLVRRILEVVAQPAEPPAVEPAAERPEGYRITSTLPAEAPTGTATRG